MQIHDEAKEHLFHEAVFRVKMGFTGDLRYTPVERATISRHEHAVRVLVHHGARLPEATRVRLLSQNRNDDPTMKPVQKALLRSFPGNEIIYEPSRNEVAKRTYCSPRL